MFQYWISKQDRWTPIFLPVPIIQPRPIQLIRQNSHRTLPNWKRNFLNLVLMRSKWFQWFFFVVLQVWSAPVWMGARLASRCSRLWRSSFALTQPSQFRSSWCWLRTAPTPVVSVGLMRWQFPTIFQLNMDTKTSTQTIIFWSYFELARPRAHVKRLNPTFQCTLAIRVQTESMRRKCIDTVVNH